MPTVAHLSVLEVATIADIFELMWSGAPTADRDPGEAWRRRYFYRLAGYDGRSATFEHDATGYGPVTGPLSAALTLTVDPSAPTHSIERVVEKLALEADEFDDGLMQVGVKSSSARWVIDPSGDVVAQFAELLPRITGLELLEAREQVEPAMWSHMFNAGACAMFAGRWASTGKVGTASFCGHNARELVQEIPRVWAESCLSDAMLEEPREIPAWLAQELELRP